MRNCFTIIFRTVAFAGLLVSLIDVKPARADVAATRPSSVSPEIAKLIDQLSSDDSSERQTASAGLLQAGTAARPAVLAAMKSDDPDVRAQATQILLKLPWSIESDPQWIQELLEKYGSYDVPRRRRVVSDLANRNSASGMAALARLINEDPSDDVRWTIVSQLRSHAPSRAMAASVVPPSPGAEPPSLEQFRRKDFPTATDGAPAWALAGYAWLGTDHAKAVACLDHCAQIEFSHPSSDDEGEFDQVIRLLAAAACEEMKFDQAASLRRREYIRDSRSDDDDIAKSLAELFALHAQAGPLAGFDDDLKLAGSAIKSAKIQYCLARMYDRTGQTGKAAAAKAAALAASTTMQQRFTVGDFVYMHGWNDLAASEFTGVLKLADEDSLEKTQWTRANAYSRLADIALDQGDDLNFIKMKKLYFQVVGEGGAWFNAFGPIDPTSDAMWAEIDWHYYRYAVAHHDTKSAEEHLKKLIDRRPTGVGFVAEIVPILQQRGQGADAQEMFQRAYDQTAVLLNMNPSSAPLMNSLAWLCAKCHQHLDQALALATAACDTDPDGGYLDTLAEVHYQMKEYDQAVQIEKQAIALSPEFPTQVQEQLKKFQAATRPSTQP